MLAFFTNLSLMECQVGYLALFLLFSVIEGFEWFWMESQVWAGASGCYWELFDKPQKRICRTVSPSLAPSLEPLPHCRNVASLSLFYRHYFGRCSSQLAQLVPLPSSQGRSTHYFDRLHNFPVTIPRCYKNVYVNSFLPHTARLWNSLPIDCFFFTYDLSGFKSRRNRHLLTAGSF